MRSFRNAMGILCVLLIGVAEAQRPNQRGRGGARPQQANRGGLNGGLNNGQRGNAINNLNNAGFNGANQMAAGMQNGVANLGGNNQAQMAQALVANFDRDGNGALDVNELMRALQGLRQMMQAGPEQVLQPRGGQQGMLGGNVNKNGNLAGPNGRGQNALGRPGGGPGGGNRGGARGRGPR